MGKMKELARQIQEMEEFLEKPKKKCERARKGAKAKARREMLRELKEKEWN